MCCGCMYVFLWLFGLLGPGSNGSVQVSDRDQQEWRGAAGGAVRRWKEAEDGMNDEHCISVSL